MCWQMYTSKDLKGLRVEHDQQMIKEGRSVVLTLKDKGLFIIFIILICQLFDDNLYDFCIDVDILPVCDISRRKLSHFVMFQFVFSV